MRATLALACAMGVAFASTRSPELSPGFAMLSFGLVDGLLSPLAGAEVPTPRRRLAARAIAAIVGAGLMAILVSAHGTARLASPWALPVCAIAATLGMIVGTLGSARAPWIVGPQIGLLDLGGVAWSFLGALSAHEAAPPRRLLVAATVGVLVLLRAFAVASLVARAKEASASLAAIGFVGWIAAASLLTMLAATPTAFSGLGTATLLTFAAILVERRHRRAIVVFLRGALAFSVAAMLGAVTLLA